MSEFGGPSESFGPQESGQVSEGLSEEAQQRFAAAAAGMQQIRREEKKSKKKDDRVAQIIIQFLDNEQHAHLFVLISRLVARDCPSIFILAILSLIHEESRAEVTQHLAERDVQSAEEAADQSLALAPGNGLDVAGNKVLITWITRMQLVLSLDPEQILLKLMVDEKNIDGTVLQLTTFVLQEFFRLQGKTVPYESIQPLTASILQTVFEPFVGKVRKSLIEERKRKEKREEDE
jgi:hypothetical protein